MSTPSDRPDAVASAAAHDQAWQACEARFRTLFEHAPIGIVLADAMSVYVDANPSACRLFGYSREEFIGLHASDIVVQAEIPLVPPALSEIDDQPSHHREWQLRRKDGSVFSADVIATKMPDGTLLGLIRDVSERQQMHDYRRHLAAIVESSRDAIIGRDLNDIVTSWNAGAEAMLGYTADEMIGTSMRRLIPEERYDEEDTVLNDLRRGVRVDRLETLRRTKDGGLIDVSATVSPTRNSAGGIVGAAEIARDITTLKDREREIARLSRLYAAMGQINQAIVWASTRDELFRAVCRALVEHGGFRLAWIGWHNPDAHRLEPVAECGDGNGYLHEINISIDDGPEGSGPASTAFRSGRPYISNDLLNDPAALPWRDEIVRRGFLASAALPIRLGGSVCGTLTVHADRRGFFHDKEISLLVEAATDLSFALDNFERDAARRLAERTLLIEKVFSDTMLQSMPGILYLCDLNGRFLRWNQTLEIATGYSGAEVARMHPRDFFTAAEWPLAEERIAEVFTKGESSVEASFVARDGSSIPCFFTGRRVLFEGRTCLVGVGIDISKRIQTEARLAESERKYRELVEHANSIILRWTIEGRVTFINEYGQRFFGYKSVEIVGRLVTETIVPPRESGGRDLERLIEHIRGDPEAFEQNINENMRRNGERVWISWTNRIVRDSAGQVVEFLSIGSDITDRVRIQAEREKRQQAEAADRVKSAFLATMSHELRTPLNSIIGFTGIMLQGLAGPLNAEQNKQLDMVRKSARHLLALVNDVLDISKIEVGQLEVAQESFDLERSLAQVVRLVTPQAHTKQLAIHVQLAPALGEAIGDQRRFEQILLNLLSNAIKFTDRGEITLAACVRPRDSASNAIAGHAAIEIRVSDTGIGISPEDLPLLFQPFRQLDSGLSRSRDGTGLGLAICRRLATLMGGAITCESAPGTGSTFSVTLPLNRAPT